jgi:transposase-like protein
MSVLSEPHFHDEEAAYAFVEARVWPEGPVCPHCGGNERIGKLAGKSTRIGTYKCYACRKPFTVKVGTVFESSHIKMHVWLQTMFLMCSSKKGISSNQLHRTLGVTLKTAWFMEHRIREAMRNGNLPQLGGDGKIVEADETYLGRLKDVPMPRGGTEHKMKIISLVERAAATSAASRLTR